MKQYFIEQLGELTSRTNSDCKSVVFFYSVSYNDSLPDQMEFVLRTERINEINLLLTDKHFVCKIGKDIVIPVFTDDCVHLKLFKEQLNKLFGEKDEKSNSKRAGDGANCFC